MNRDFFAADALNVAPKLLGVELTLDSADGPVSVRVTEVEAYHGLGVAGVYDGGSHSKDKRTERNASMFGPPGHAYVYLNYGMHFALNMVCSPEGIASGVLIRSAEVIAGEELADARRRAKRGDTARPIPHHMLARGPGNFAAALGITRPTHDGKDLFAAPFHLEAARTAPTEILSGPRVGVAGAAGGPAFPWRFWIAGDRTVSAFRPGRDAHR